MFGGDLGGDSGAVGGGGGAVGHDEARSSVVVGEESVVFGESEEGLGVGLGDARDAGEVASGSVVGEIREFGFALLDIGGDGVGGIFVGAHLFEDALVLDVALVIFVFFVPLGVGFAVVDAVGTVDPAHIIDDILRIINGEDVADEGETLDDGAESASVGGGTELVEDVGVGDAEGGVALGAVGGIVGEVGVVSDFAVAFGVAIKAVMDGIDIIGVARLNVDGGEVGGGDGVAIDVANGANGFESGAVAEGGHIARACASGGDTADE